MAPTVPRACKESKKKCQWTLQLHVTKGTEVRLKPLTRGDSAKLAGFLHMVNVESKLLRHFSKGSTASARENLVSEGGHDEHVPGGPLFWEEDTPECEAKLLIETNFDGKPPSSRKVCSK